MAYEYENDFTEDGKFKKSNQIWRVRSSHGRDKIFSTPADMWAAAVEYFEWVDENPLYTAEYKTEGKKLVPVSIPVKRPYTLMALCQYMGVNSAYFRNFKVQLKPDDENYHDFNTVIANIEETIYNQKFEGATAGFFNANIIARDLGLADKKDIRANVFGSDTEINFE